MCSRQYFLCLMRYEYDVPTWRLNNFLAMVEIGGGDSGGSEWGEGRDEDSTSPTVPLLILLGATPSAVLAQSDSWVLTARGTRLS